LFIVLLSWEDIQDDDQTPVVPTKFWTAREVELRKKGARGMHYLSAKVSQKLQ
jgi:hypothetical protein